MPTFAEEVETTAHWDDLPVHAAEQEDFTTLALELWLRASQPEATAADEWLDDEELLGGHASCL